MKYFYNPEFGLVTKKNLLQAKYDICSFYFRGLNLIRICIIVYSIVVVLVVKSPPANAGDVRGVGSIPGWGRSPGGGNGNPLQYFASKIPWTEETGGLQSMGLQSAP